MSGWAGGSFEKPLSLLLWRDVTTWGGGTGGAGGCILRPPAKTVGNVPDGRICVEEEVKVYEIYVSFFLFFIFFFFFWKRRWSKEEISGFWGYISVIESLFRLFVHEDVSFIWTFLNLLKHERLKEFLFLNVKYLVDLFQISFKLFVVKNSLFYPIY